MLNLTFQRGTEFQKFTQARTKPFLPFTGFSGAEILEKVKSDYFPELKEKRILFYFIKDCPLASIFQEEKDCSIYIHTVINSPRTPPEVLSFIFKHELLHLKIPARPIKGSMTSHPPEFWQKEREISPERIKAWAWLWINLRPCLELRTKLERIDVRSNWRDIWNKEKMDLSECEKISRKKISPGTKGGDARLLF
jgi:hypothetical protein